MNQFKPIPGNEPTVVITPRVPASMHAALLEEAHQRRTSLNKLCISKLLMPISSLKVIGPAQTVQDAWDEAKPKGNSPVGPGRHWKRRISDAIWLRIRCSA